MDAAAFCEVCGNELDNAVVCCPFCGVKRAATTRRTGGPQYRVVNLEKGMPLVHQALLRLRQEIETARRQGCGVLVLIHGYGSSGKGGTIKKEVRRQLGYMLDRHQLNDVLPGEEVDPRTGRSRQFLRRFPFLAAYLKHANPGVTLVVF